MRKVAIVIVNWNGWRDTLECLESLFRNDYRDYQVVVCDNASTDGSVDKIRRWAQGDMPAYVNAGGRLGRLSQPQVSKPIQFVECDQSAAEKGGELYNAPLVLIRCSENLGFAGGNNVALCYVLAHHEFEYAWLLNNDTVIESDALIKLVQRINASPGAGMCGSLLPYYDRPERIWAQGGGAFNCWLAQSRCLGNDLLVADGLSADEVERRMAYVAGASLLVTRDFLETVGLLCEDYFLYFEEPDWAFRARGLFKMVYAPDSIVYHKVARSTRLVSQYYPTKTSSYDYACRNALKFTRKFSPLVLPTVTLWMGGKWLIYRASLVVRHMLSQS